MDSGRGGERREWGEEARGERGRGGEGERGKGGPEGYRTGDQREHGGPQHDATQGRKRAFGS